MARALIFESKVVDVQDADFEVNPSMTWVDCPDGTEIGDGYDGSTFTTRSPANTSAEKLNFLRIERDKKLAETDYLALSDNTMSAAMTTYRQALRDITDTYSDLDTVVWPTKP